MRPTDPGCCIYSLPILLMSLYISPIEAAQDALIDGVPIPADASPSARGLEASTFSGVWAGSWGGVLKTILIVEAVEDDGSARVVYAVGDNPMANLPGQWFRFSANVDGKVMTVDGQGFDVTYSHTGTGRLQAEFAGEFDSHAVMVPTSLDALDQNPTGRRWDAGVQQFLRTDLHAKGKPVSLETIIFKPPGDGPFPLAVVNHGSTGRGDDASLFTDTWTDPWLAEWLNARGWLVAFPQRRGRGQSDGLYDEGFDADRSRGYTCEPERSLAGADRALQDIEAAIDSLRDRPDIDTDPILLAGNSRGGILSVAYAGLHPRQVSRVVNFVGGWIGDACHSADSINQSLFERGAEFGANTLWLYGDDDPYYSMKHSRQNFDAFVAAGGQGEFIELSVPGRQNGHWVLSVPPLWARQLGIYLDMDPTTRSDYK